MAIYKLYNIIHGMNHGIQEIYLSESSTKDKNIIFLKNRFGKGIGLFENALQNFYKIFLQRLKREGFSYI